MKKNYVFRMTKRARRLEMEGVLAMLYEIATDMQCSDDSSDSGDDEPLMVGSDDQFSDLDTEGTTPLFLLFIRAGVYKYSLTNVDMLCSSILDAYKKRDKIIHG